jgi:hypothetical protein
MFLKFLFFSYTIKIASSIKQMKEKEKLNVKLIFIILNLNRIRGKNVPTSEFTRVTMVFPNLYLILI